jgi:hypothetical protein
VNQKNEVDVTYHRSQCSNLLRNKQIRTQILGGPNDYNKHLNAVPSLSLLGEGLMWNEVSVIDEFSNSCCSHHQILVIRQHNHKINQFSFECCSTSAHKIYRRNANHILATQKYSRGLSITSIIMLQTVTASSVTTSEVKVCWCHHHPKKSEPFFPVTLVKRLTFCLSSRPSTAFWRPSD